MEKINHFNHPHPLVLVDQEPGDHGSRKGFCFGCNGEVKGYCYQCRKAAEGYCFGCEEALEGSSYGCGECGFFLHKKCAELQQREITNHALYPLHHLILHLEDSPYNYYNVCSKRIRFFYRCHSCKFDLDLRCAVHPQFVAQGSQKHQHFSHDHPLIYVEDIEIQTKEKLCSGCREPMYKSSSFYYYPNCMFHLHKKCAALPLEINRSANQK